MDKGEGGGKDWEERREGELWSGCKINTFIHCKERCGCLLLFMSVHEHICMCMCAQAPWGRRIPWAGVTGNCELPALGSGHRTQAIWKSRKRLIYCATSPAPAESLRLARLGDSV